MSPGRAAGVAMGRRSCCIGMGLMALSLGGCAVQKLARGTPGIDLRSIGPGSRRADVEAVLGSPWRRWTTPVGVAYCMYVYDAGIPGSMADAAAYAFFDIVSLGLFEVFAATDPTFEAQPGNPRRIGKLAVSYDDAGIVLGVFPDIGDFAELPPDGRAPAGR